MKEVIKVVTWLTFIGLLVGIGLHSLSTLVERKDSYSKYKPFYQQEGDFDVLFMGQSHVLNGIYPMELWNDYGIVSYNFGGHGNRLATTYWVMKNALDYTKPKLIVVDCAMIAHEDKTGPAEQVHLSLDHFPLTEHKKAAVKDLFPDEKTQINFLWKFSTYHNRWNVLTPDDFVPKVNVEKGAESRIGVAVPLETVFFDSSLKLEGSTMGIQYLEKIIEECQSSGIEILLTYLPFPDNTGWQAESNRVWDIAEKYHVNYLDYYTLYKLITPSTDFYDENSHLNPSGARKITQYLGEYIMEHYQINDQRHNPVYANWYHDYLTYSCFKYDNIKAQENMKNYLMLLYDKNLSYTIHLPQTPSVVLNSVYRKLLENLGVDLSMVSLTENTLVLVDNKNKSISYHKIDEPVKTSLGIMQLGNLKDNKAELLLDGKALYEVTSQPVDLSIVVYDHTTNELIDVAQFEDGHIID